MPVYEWKRIWWRKDGEQWPDDDTLPPEGDESWEPYWQQDVTMDHAETPPGVGWKRVYSLGISAVSGAGGSPGRKVDTSAS